MKQSVRIIGGQYRGKKLFFPDVADLRPTSDRIRETLFNWLMQDIRDARCLDAFAGSGALGFEAFSRGACQVTLVETALPVYHNLQRIGTSFASTRIKIIHADALDYCKKTKELFDIIFLDPPFSQQNHEEYFNLLAENNCLVVNGLLYVESPTLIKPNPQLWLERKAKKAGNVFYALYQKVKQ